MDTAEKQRNSTKSRVQISNAYEKIIRISTVWIKMILEKILKYPNPSKAIMFLIFLVVLNILITNSAEFTSSKLHKFARNS